MTDDMNLDLIQMVQRARMQNDDNALPSQMTAAYWVEAKAPQGGPTPRAGALIIETKADVIDDLWKQIKAATEAGKLGYKAKASTSPGKSQPHASDRLIHIRVADGDDTADLERIRAALREMGVSGEIPFNGDKN
ncbi:MAG: putative phosphothreonine lyase domain-containing protein [Chloroflexota bacterium]